MTTVLKLLLEFALNGTCLMKFDVTPGPGDRVHGCNHDLLNMLTS